MEFKSSCGSANLKKVKEVKGLFFIISFITLELRSLLWSSK
ncbi:22592_t:CDS:1, partial [Dentiscutata erythropus]